MNTTDNTAQAAARVALEPAAAPARRRRTWVFGSRETATRPRAVHAARVPIEALAPAGTRMLLDDALPKNDFLHALQREKRRADRSRAPLSMALYRLTDEDGATASVRRLSRILHASKRETDILSHLGDDLIAVLFPDTHEAGLRRFVEKIDAQANGLAFSTVTATYPDYLFENLENGILALQSAQDAMVDDDDPAKADDGYLLKRPLDIVGALLALVLLSPLMLLTALAVRLTSPGPVIFRQHRMGKGGVPFVFYKFRSMSCNADDAIHRQFVENLIKGGAAGSAPGTVYKMTADPRITRIGSIIRKTSIDELPQLFNVLKGDMSLVGPRPPLPYEAECYESWHLRRVLDMRPGLTGLWQVDGRSKVGFDDMVRMDLRYIRTCSLWLDLRILLKTVMVVLRCDGAV